MLQHHRIIRDLPEFKDKKIKISRLGGGMTNFNYLIVHGRNKYVARFAPATSKFLGLDRVREIHNYEVAHKAGIGPRVFKHYPKHSSLIVEYVEGKNINARKARQPETIRKMGELFRKLHAASKMKGSFDQVTRAKMFIAIAKNYKVWMPENLNYIFEQVHKAQKQLAPISKKDPCHLDLMLENIIETPAKKLKLIDWEFAGNADFRYDLAMFSVKGEFSHKEDQMLVEAYRGKPDDKLLADLQAMKVIVYFFEMSYGLLQQAISKRNIDYKAYAQQNIESLEKLSS